MRSGGSRTGIVSYVLPSGGSNMASANYIIYAIGAIVVIFVVLKLAGII